MIHLGLPPALYCNKSGGSCLTYYWHRGKRYGKVNEHNALVPRDHWLEAWERTAIVAFHADHALEGYRRLTYMMMDADVVAASPATVYRVLASAGCFERWNRTPSKKGAGFQQPLADAFHRSFRHCRNCWAAQAR